MPRRCSRASNAHTRAQRICLRAQDVGKGAPAATAAAEHTKLAGEDGTPENLLAFKSAAGCCCECSTPPAFTEDKHRVVLDSNTGLVSAPSPNPMARARGEQQSAQGGSLHTPSTQLITALP